MNEIQNDQQNTPVADDTQFKESLESHFRTLLKAMGDVVLVIDRKGRFVRIDAEKPDSVYNEGNDFPGEPLTGVYNADLAALFLRGVQRSFKSHRTVNIEYSIAGENEDRWFAAVVSPMTQSLALFVARDITELKAIQSRLEVKTVKLEAMNANLNVLIDRMKESTRNLEETIISNVSTFVLPHIKHLKKMRLSDVQMAYVELIEINLSRLTSPLIHDMRQFNLTPMEIQVAKLVKDGRTTRDIAALLHTSKVAIDNHRYNIRKKLGLNKKKENIRSFLQSIV